MQCSNTTRGLSAYVDGAGSVDERRAMALHVSNCADCAVTVEQYENMRRSLRALPPQLPSAHLYTALQVVASKERARRQARLSFARSFMAWRDRTQLLLNNLMRPLALPVAGGVVSAMLLFGMLFPDFAVVLRVKEDLPTTFLTEASVKETAAVSISENELVVDLFVDENGKMTDYSIVRGANLLHDPLVRRRFEYNLLFTQFHPATQFGQPISGKIRVSFQTSKIDVRG